MAYLALMLSGCAYVRASTPLRLDNPPALRDIAFRHYLENEAASALDFYQKAIDKSVKDYGANATYTGELYLEASTVALQMSKFNLAENYLTKAVSINPNSLVARMRLATLLRLRQKPDSELAQIQLAIARHEHCPEAGSQLVAWLQQNNPAQATRQAFLLGQANSNNESSSGQTSNQTKNKPESLAHITPIAVGAVPAVKTINKREVQEKPADNKHLKDRKNRAKNRPPKQKSAQQSKTQKVEPGPSAKSLKPAQSFVAKKPMRKTKNSSGLGLIPPPPPLAPGIPTLAPETSAAQNQTKPESKKHKRKDKKELPGKNPAKEGKPGASTAETEPSTVKEAPPAPVNTSNPDADSNFLIDWGGVKNKK